MSMKILIVDIDDLSTEMMKSKLQDQDYEVDSESSKNNILDRLNEKNYDLIILDPSPLKTPKQIILSIRRQIKGYPYILLASDTIDSDDALKSGCNDFLSKPISEEDLLRKVVNAQVFTALVDRIGDDSEDFPSAGGVIAKSAYNQLFLSAIDRADRYNEKSYVLFIALKNYEEILQMDGPYAADYAVAKLSQYLVRLRRQSDIIGQTAKHEHGLILQRPIYDSEPLEAAKRFAEALSKYNEIAEDNKRQAVISVSLVQIPTGDILVEHIVNS